MTHQKVPEAIASAVDALVQPYGLNFNALLNPKQSNTPDTGSKNYFSYREAAKFCSLSIYSLGRAVKAGELAVCKLSPSKNGKILIAIDELNRWLNSKRKQV